MWGTWISRTYSSSSPGKVTPSAAAIYYGEFANVLINFLIIALVMFLLLRAVMRMRKPKEAPALTTKECPYCKTQIPIGATRCPHCTSQLGG